MNTPSPSQPQKHCPKCKTAAALQATACAVCGHTFRTRFDANGRPVVDSSPSTAPAAPVPTIAPRLSAPGAAAPLPLSVSPARSSRKPAVWIIGGVALVFLVGAGLNRAIYNLRRAQMPEWQRAIEDADRASADRRAAWSSMKTVPGSPQSGLTARNAKHGAAILFPGLALPKGFDIPLATDKPEDLTLWMKTVPGSVNGEPMSTGDERTRGELLIQRRIITFPVTTAVEILDDGPDVRDKYNPSWGGPTTRVRIRDGINKDQIGYVLTGMLHSDEPSTPGI